MSLDLNKLANKLNEALSNETTETLTKFLNDKRMSNKKQSSVESLFQKLWDTPKDKFTWYAILEEHKEMHKEEIAEAYWNGSDGIEGKTYIIEMGKEYYNQTFG